MSPRPSPSTKPCTEQMTGFQLTACVKRSAELVPQPCGPPSFSNSSRLRNWRWRTSAPLQKARPRPLRMATSASGSRSKRRKASASCRTTSSLTAFNLSGRFSVIVAIRSTQAYSTKFWGSVSIAPSRALPQSLSRQLARGGGRLSTPPRRRHTAAGDRHHFGSDHVKHVQQDDDRDRNPDEPKKNAAHVSDPIGCCGYIGRQALVLADDLFDRVLRLADAAAGVAFTL